MKPKNSSWKLANIANLSSKLLGNQDYILEFDKQIKNLRASKITLDKFYNDSHATMKNQI